MTSIGIVGGGPGGLFTAYLIQQYAEAPIDVTILEASDRLGGKLMTRRFGGGARYEAGAAELYDYSHLGEDPVRETVGELGLRTIPIGGDAVILDGRVMGSGSEVRARLGDVAWRSLRAFDAMARQWMSPSDYYDADWANRAADRMDGITFEDVLRDVEDPEARRYLRTLVHSDVAAEPNGTSASYGLQNYLMNDPAYMRLYVVEGGLEELPRALAARVHARIVLDARVVRVGRTGDGRLRVSRRSRDGDHAEDFDAVVVALPLDCLRCVAWDGAPLESAMRAHHVRYDYLGHYLRVTMLFDRAFWRAHLRGSYFMMDAFGGCCLYDESSRDGSDTAVLGCLIAGEDALRLSNLDDATLASQVMAELQRAIVDGGRLLESRVHRWIGCVNARPGGYPRQDVALRHIPEPDLHPNLFVVGDYLFDSTVNGVFDSAAFVAEAICELPAGASTEGAR